MLDVSNSNREEKSCPNRRLSIHYAKAGDPKYFGATCNKATYVAARLVSEPSDEG